MPPNITDKVAVPPPYLNVRDLFTVLSFKYLMINWGGGGVSGGLKYDHEILEQPLK